MKVLFVTSGDDYAALSFEGSNKYKVEEMWQKAWDNNDKHYIIIEDKKENVFAEFFAYEFGEVDPEFIKFIENRGIDYDDAKHNNFYVVEE